MILDRRPDRAKVKDKMLFASSNQIFKNKLALPIEIQATDLDEVSFNTGSFNVV